MELEGTKLHLTPLTPEDYAEARAYVRTLDPDPLNGIIEICNQMHPEVAKVLALEAFRSRERWGSLTEGPGASWVGSAEGTAFLMYRRSRRHHPELTQEWFLNALISKSDKFIYDLQNKIVELSGLTKNPTTTPKPLTKKKRKKK